MMTKEQIKISEINKQNAIKHFEDTGELPKDRAKCQYVLHHIDPSWRQNDVERYIQWNSADLIVMTKSEHTRLHHTGKYVSEETRKKQSESLKGRKYKPMSEEGKKNISEAAKGRVFSEETRRKLSEAKKGKSLSEEHRKHISDKMKTYKWYTDGKIDLRVCSGDAIPEGFVPGRKPYKKKGVYHYNGTSTIKEIIQ